MSRHILPILSARHYSTAIFLCCRYERPRRSFTWPRQPGSDQMDIRNAGRTKTEEPSSEQIAEYVRKTLSAGKVVPGYGHAVLRKTDPRFEAQMEFGKTHARRQVGEHRLEDLRDRATHFAVARQDQNPWPNVDAHSGALLVHYGLVERILYRVVCR